jgi:hypothetical protein
MNFKPKSNSENDFDVVVNWSLLRDPDRVMTG